MTARAHAAGDFRAATAPIGSRVVGVRPRSVLAGREEGGRRGG